jgi:photosystem II stability/assembly factor-like uncharacterized protein
MKKQYIISISALMLALVFSVGIWNMMSKTSTAEGPEKLPKKDRIDLAMEQEFRMTRDMETNEVPRRRLMAAKKYADQLRNDISNRTELSNLEWEERGPDTVSGRTRAILIDANDASGNIVWAGSVGGGLWKSTDAGASWAPVNEFFANLAVTTIAQDPSNSNIMYFGTGEGWFNSDAIRGLGIWRTTDGGNTWTQLSSTNAENDNTFHYVQKIVVNSTGTVFAATRNDGVQRSEDGGENWDKVLGSGTGVGALNSAADLEIASDGDIYAALGIFERDGIYKSTDEGDSWTKLAGGLPTVTGYERIELACAPNDSEVVYAMFQLPKVTGIQNSDCLGIYRTGDGGTTWTQKTEPSAFGMSDFTRGQAWYDFICAVDPNNSNRLFVGGIDLHLSANGGDSWTQISQWSGRDGKQYVHADQHAIVFESGSSDKIWFGNDGGVYRTTNGSATIPTIESRKQGYNVTQYYAADLVRTAGSDTIIAGAQDNGTTLFTEPGINSTNEVTGGDGAFCHIDADEPLIQISAYTRNRYYITTNGWESNNYVGISSSKGQFINPTDYDSDANILYGGYDEGKYSFVSNIGGTGSLSSGTRSISAFDDSEVSCVTVDPNVNNRVYFGLFNGDVVRVDNAHSSSATGTLIRSGTGSTSSIAIEDGDQFHIIVTYSNYGAESVWETTDGGASWFDIEGNLPDIPVRSVIFHPNDENQVLLGTELGVWTTDNTDGSVTEWTPSTTSLANVRVDMLQARKSDNVVIAATHGRGLFSAVLPGEAGTAPTCSATISSFPYEESFETDFGNWTQSSSDDFDWERESGGTDSDGTGPSGAIDGSWYVYMEVSNSNHPDKDAILESPCFDVSDLENPVLNFSYHMKGSDLGRLEVDASVDGITWTGLSTFTQSVDSWRNATIRLDDYADETALRLRFYGTSGDGYRGDICIDRIRVFDDPIVSDNCSIYTLSILTDDYAREVGWEVKRDGQVVASRNAGFYTTDFNQYEEFLCLPTGCYEFIMKDSHGDGLCCGYGEGNYSLTDENGMVIASGADYDHAETTTFCVDAELSCPAINFNNVTFSSHGGSQDGSGSFVQVQDGGSTVFLSNNAWKSFAFNYTVTENTYLRFDFRSTEEGEGHAIGFASNATEVINDQIFQLYGSQDATQYGTNVSYENYSGTDWKTYVIPVGSWFTGTFDRIFFVNDNDANQSVGNSYFRNVRVYDGNCLIGEEPVETLGENTTPPQIETRRISAEVHAFPNPFRDEIQVDIPDHIGNAQVSLIDMNGRVIQSIQWVQGQVTLGQNINLAPGMYFIQVSAKDFEQNLKVVNIR